MLTLPGLSDSNTLMKDALPSIIMMDEPDSRLDKRGAICLRRLLCGAGGPSQCILTTLNNHGAFSEGEGAVALPEVVTDTSFDLPNDSDDDPYGDLLTLAEA